MISPTESIQRCNFCENGNLHQFENFSCEIDLKYEICDYCTLVHMNPKYSESELEGIFANEYNNHPKHNQERSNKQQEIRGDYFIKFLFDFNITNISSCLDIGSGDGLILNKFKTIYDLNLCIGIEPSNKRRKKCLDLGLDVKSQLSQIDKKLKFDMIILSHILEHVYNPKIYLNKIKNMLTPGGYLLIEVPNLFGHISYERTHLYCFWSQSLKNLLQSLGFKILLLKKHSTTHPNAKGYRYITCIAQLTHKEKEIRSYNMKLIKFFRKIGTSRLAKLIRF